MLASVSAHASRRRFFRHSSLDAWWRWGRFQRFPSSFSNGQIGHRTNAFGYVSLHPPGGLCRPGQDVRVCRKQCHPLTEAAVPAWSTRRSADRHGRHSARRSAERRLLLILRAVADNGRLERAKAYGMSCPTNNVAWWKGDARAPDLRQNGRGSLPRDWSINGSGGIGRRISGQKVTEQLIGKSAVLNDGVEAFR
jgi:hypothetical protein